MGTYMRIAKTDSYTKVEQKQNNRDFISSVLDEIFLICKEDKQFDKVKRKIEKINETVDNIQMKINRQNELLTKSGEIKNSITRRLSILDNENFRMKNELLENLGSSL